MSEALCARTLERCKTPDKCLAANECGRYDAIAEDLPSGWENPSWDDRGKVHDWRNYIPEPVMKRWRELSCETKMVAACMAEVQAKREEWE